MEKLLNVPQVADLLGFSPRTVYNLAERGEIPVQRVRRAVRFRPSAIQAWLAEQARPAGWMWLNKHGKGQ